MKTLFEQLKSVKSMEEADAVISAHPTVAERKTGDILEQFQLWIEYLKRSETYKKVCEWFAETKEGAPYPETLTEEVGGEAGNIDALRDYFVFAAGYQRYRDQSPLVPLKQHFHFVSALKSIPLFDDLLADTFFVWAKKAGFLSKYNPEMLMNLYVFGDVHQEPTNVSAARVVHIIENRRFVYRLDEIMDVIFKHIENDENSFSDVYESPDTYKTALKRYFKRHLTPTICIIDPHENMDKMIENIKDEIGILREIYPDPKKSQNAKLLYSEFKPDQFEWPTAYIRLDGLKRYLEVYDLQVAGTKYKEIGKIYYSNYDPENAKTTAMRDKRLAAKIIKNVENGFFPGDY